MKYSRLVTLRDVTLIISDKSWYWNCSIEKYANQTNLNSNFYTEVIKWNGVILKAVLCKVKEKWSDWNVAYKKQIEIFLHTKYLWLSESGIKWLIFKKDTIDDVKSANVF